MASLLTQQIGAEAKTCRADLEDLNHYQVHALVKKVVGPTMAEKFLNAEITGCILGTFDSVAAIRVDFPEIRESTANALLKKINAWRTEGVELPREGSVSTESDTSSPTKVPACHE